MYMRFAVQYILFTSILHDEETKKKIELEKCLFSVFEQPFIIFLA